MYWTLTSVFGVALLLVGYNWYTSNKIFERGRHHLKEETLNETNAAVQKLASELDTKIQKPIVAVDDKSLAFKNELSSQAASLTADVEKRTIDFAADFVQRLTTHRTEIDEAMRAVTNKQLPEMESRLKTLLNDEIKGLDAKFREVLDGRTETLKTDLLIVSWRLHTSLAEQASGPTRPVLDNELLWHVIAARVACGHGSQWEWMISSSLNSIAICLQKGAIPSKFAQGEFAELEDRIPPSVRDNYHRINALFQSLKASNAQNVFFGLR